MSKETNLALIVVDDIGCEAAALAAMCELSRRHGKTPVTCSLEAINGLLSLDECDAFARAIARTTRPVMWLLYHRDGPTGACDSMMHAWHSIRRQESATRMGDYEDWATAMRAAGLDETWVEIIGGDE